TGLLHNSRIHKLFERYGCAILQPDAAIQRADAVQPHVEYHADGLQRVFRLEGVQHTLGGALDALRLWCDVADTRGLRVSLVDPDAGLPANQGLRRDEDLKVRRRRLVHVVPVADFDAFGAPGLRAERAVPQQAEQRQQDDHGHGDPANTLDRPLLLLEVEIMLNLQTAIVVWHALLLEKAAARQGPCSTPPDRDVTSF